MEQLNYNGNIINIYSWCYTVSGLNGYFRTLNSAKKYIDTLCPA